MESQTTLMTDREVATELRMGLTKTRRLIREGTIPSVTIGGHRRIRRARLEEYLEALDGQAWKPTHRNAPTTGAANAANARRAAGAATRRRVVEYRTQHPTATKEEVAAALDVSVSTVVRYTAA